MAIEQPGARDVHVDKLMTNLSIAYRNEEYIADRVFPTVMVEKQSDLILTYPLSDWLRPVMAPYAPGSEGARSGYRVDKSKTYFCMGWKLGKLIPDDVLNNADEPINMFRDATAWLQEQGQLRWELEFATNHFAAGKWTTERAGGTDFVVWSNIAGSDPIKDLRQFGDIVRQLTGRKVNTWVFSKKVWDVLVDHPLIVDRLKYTSRESLTPEMLARLVGYETTYIGSAIYESAAEGATSAPTEIFGNHALGLHVAPRPGVLTPSAGYTFIWRPVTGTPFFFRRLRNDEKETWIQEVKSFYDQRQIDASLGVFLNTAI